MSVTAEYVLRGYALALEQCGLLLRDANSLYRNESYATAVALAAFAREELGRSQILLDFWRKNSTITVDQIESACNDHVEKQRAGMLSSVMTADNNSGLGKLLIARHINPPQSKEWKDADAELKKIDEAKGKRTPSHRHEKRMMALYVEPTSSTGWNRPADMSAKTAHDFLRDAGNDYSLRQSQDYISLDDSGLKTTDPELYKGLEQLADRPVLPVPEWQPCLPDKNEPNMSMAYVSFCKPVNFDTATGLLNYIRSTLSHSIRDKPSNFDSVRLMMSSGGGNITASFGTYNEIKSMPIEIHTMNTGATDSRRRTMNDLVALVARRAAIIRIDAVFRLSVRTAAG